MKYLVFSFFLFLSFLNLNAQKDSIVLANKDVLLGEIKSMDKGILIFKTDYSDADLESFGLKLTKFIPLKNIL